MRRPEILPVTIPPIHQAVAYSKLPSKMPAFQPRVPRAVYAISFLILQQSQIAHAAPALIARSENATSGSGLSQPEKITLYVVAAIGGLFALLGVAIYILRSRHQKKYQNHSQRMTRSILKTLPIVQYQYQNGNELPCPSTRTSSIDSCDDLANEKLAKQRNTACPICTDDFIENQMMRILPCDHQYHKACIEDWLSRGSFC